MWTDCPDWIQAIIQENIRGSIRAKMEKEHGVRQDRREGYSDDWATGATEQQSQPSSQATQRLAHQIETPSSRRIGTPVGQQDSQNDSQDTDLSFDFCQMPSATHVMRFFRSDTASADDRRGVTGEQSPNRTMSPSPSRSLSLSLDGIEPAQDGTSDSEHRDVEQGRNGSVS